MTLTDEHGEPGARAVALLEDRCRGVRVDLAVRRRDELDRRSVNLPHQRVDPELGCGRGVGHRRPYSPNLDITQPKVRPSARNVEKKREKKQCTEDYAILYRCRATRTRKASVVRLLRL